MLVNYAVSKHNINYYFNWMYSTLYFISKVWLELNWSLFSTLFDNLTTDISRLGGPFRPSIGFSGSKQGEIRM